MSSDGTNYKIDPNNRMGSEKRTAFGPVRRPEKDFKDFLNIGKDEDESDGGEADGKKKELLNEQRIGGGSSSGDQAVLNLFDLSAKSSSSMKTQKQPTTAPPIANTAPPERPAVASLTEDAPGMINDSPQNTAQQQTSSQSQSSTYHSNLFDLAAASPTGLQSESTQSQQKQVSPDDSGNVVNSADPRAAALVNKPKKTDDTLFVEEKADLAAVASSQQKQINIPTMDQPEASNDGVSSRGPDYKTIQQIIDQIVDKIYVLKEDGRSDTTIVLKNPPLFDGVKVTLTSFTSASGQVNITFENLTQMAKNVLDAQANRDALKQGLDSKGVVVQMFTTTTTSDVVAAPFPGNSKDQNREQQEGFGGQGGNQQQQQDEDET